MANNPFWSILNTVEGAAVGAAGGMAASKMMGGKSGFMGNQQKQGESGTQIKAKKVTQ